MTKLHTLVVLGIFVGTFAYPDPLQYSRDLSGWNSTENTDLLDDEMDYNDYELEDSEGMGELTTRANPSVSRSVVTFDFESDETSLGNFKCIYSSKEISKKYHKSKESSLLWKWESVTDPTNKPLLTLSLANARSGKEVMAKRGGIKFWIYRANKAPSSKMKLVFAGRNKRGKARSSATDINLDFKGWRGIWISYMEFADFNSLKKITDIELTIESSLADELYIDLFQFSKVLNLQTRDRVVPQVGQKIQGKSIESPHDDKDFWQQTLRWDHYQKSRYTQTISNAETYLQDIKEIEDRIHNWYIKNDESILKITKDSTADTGTDTSFNFDKMKAERWNDLWAKAAKAHLLYDKIDFDKRRPHLFPKVAEYGANKIETGLDSAKFGDVFNEVLLPISLECSIMDREVEVRYLAKRLCKNLVKEDTTKKFKKGVKEVAGDSETMQNKFKQLLNEKKAERALECPPADSNSRALQVERIIEKFNDFRYERIKKLLHFLQDQGIAAGSSLGSLDHEMNKIGSGFVNSVFILRKRIRKEPELLEELISAMKWYSDFNEIYQPATDYIYDGTTTDRMRTILLYRLLIILMKESKGEDEIHDLNHLKEWIHNAVTINKGLGGVVKPDYTGFHHKTFYGSAYVPQALHNAALVQFFLDGTLFELDKVSKDNIRKSLEVLRMVSVKYSTPNGIAGRFPGYSKAILTRMIPAYAYISYVHPKDGVAEGVNNNGMFLRLFDSSNPKIKDYLQKGAPSSHIYYWNTIGSLDVISKVATLKCASKKKCEPEKSPSGHWSKNFASLSVHRRKDWSVAVKGFSRYTWDFEGTSQQNGFGVFQSHGTLQISNSEAALDSYDIQNGWDWTKIPGATTVTTNDFDKLHVKARTYNHKGFAGGVNFIGSTGTSPKQGAFGMLFKKPDYLISEKVSDSPLLRLLEFRKSFFFYDDLIICLGSDIKFDTKKSTDDVFPLTTLFQDKNLKDSKIKVNGVDKILDKTYSQTWYKQNVAVTLEDTNENTYKIKMSHYNTLKVKISEQTSEKDRGNGVSKGWYATAWLKHAKESPEEKRSTCPRCFQDQHELSGDQEGSEVLETEKARENLDDQKDQIIRTKDSEGAFDGYDEDLGSSAQSTSGEDDENSNEEEINADGSAKTSFKYDYAVVISGGDVTQLDKYKVLQHDHYAHIIQLNDQFSNSADKVFGYSVFQNLQESSTNKKDGRKYIKEGPIKHVNGPCMIMAEKRDNKLKLAISYHDMGFEYDTEKKDKDVCKKAVQKKKNKKINVFAPKYNRDVGVDLMFCSRGLTSKITIRLRQKIKSLATVIVDGKTVATKDQSVYVKAKSNKKRLEFLNLVNGFTNEVELELVENKSQDDDDEFDDEDSYDAV